MFHNQRSLARNNVFYEKKKHTHTYPHIMRKSLMCLFIFLILILLSFDTFLLMQIIIQKKSVANDVYHTPPTNTEHPARQNYFLSPTENKYRASKQHMPFGTSSSRKATAAAITNTRSQTADISKTIGPLNERDIDDSDNRNVELLPQQRRGDISSNLPTTTAAGKFNTATAAIPAAAATNSTVGEMHSIPNNKNKSSSPGNVIAVSPQFTLPPPEDEHILVVPSSKKATALPYVEFEQVHNANRIYEIHKPLGPPKNTWKVKSGLLTKFLTNRD